MKTTILTLSLFAFFFSFSQMSNEIEISKEVEKKIFEEVKKHKVIEYKGHFFLPIVDYFGEMLPQIKLKSVIIFPELKFKSKRDYLKYKKLIRNVKKVYPYARYAARKLEYFEKKMQGIKSESKRNIYMKKANKVMKKRFDKPIRNMTRSQGRLLVKLIDRETGSTSYELVKELRGSLNAFVYQSLARLFGQDLKSTYDPIHKDKLIERLVILYKNGQL